MNIIEPKVEYWKQTENIAHVAKCARVCYGKEKGNDIALYKNLEKDKHLSMFRHESVYAIIPNHDRDLGDNTLSYATCPYIQIHVYNGHTYVATNKNFILDNIDFPFIKLVLIYRVEPDVFRNTEIGFQLMRYTFCITTQISTSRELNRVSPNNISEQSTRYVYEGGTICRPWWLTNYEHKDKQEIDYTNKVDLYLVACMNAFHKYRQLIDAGLHRQDARGVLPLDTATKCVYTYSIKEWKHIVELRTSPRAHKNAQIIANMIKKELEDLGYDFK